MLGIIICDDDKFMLDISRMIAENCIKKYRLDAKVVCQTVNSHEAINYLSKNKEAFLCFLDLDFGQNTLNGLDVSKMIKEMSPASKTVFVTSHTDKGMDILKSGVEAFGFVEKTTETYKMELAYKKYITLALGLRIPDSTEKSSERKIDLPVGIDEFVSIPVLQILYVESVKTISHFICYHTVDGSSISIRDTIENALGVLGDDFMKSHRSIIINKRHVIGLVDGVVKFSNGESVACSFRLKNNIMRECLS